MLDPYNTVAKNLVGGRSGGAARSALDQKHEWDHAETHNAEDPEHIDKGEHGRLALEFVVEQRLRLVKRTGGVGAALAEHCRGAVKGLHIPRVEKRLVANEVGLVHLRQAHLQGGHEGDADAATDVAGQIDEACGVIHALLGDKSKGGDVDRDEEKRQRATGDSPDEDESPKAGEKIQFRETEHSQRENQQADNNQPAGMKTREQPTDERQTNKGNDGAGREDVATELRGVAHQGLQQHRQQDRGAIENDAEREHGECGGRIVPVFEKMQFDDGIFLAQLPDNRADQPDRGGNRTPDDEVGGEPVVALALIKHDLQESGATAEQAGTDETNPHFFALRVAGKMRWVVNQGRGKKDGDQANGDVDEENPAPGVIVGDPAAERRPDDWRDHDTHAVNRHRHALFFTGEALDEDGLGDGLQPPSPCSLQNPEEDQQREAW